MMSVRLCLICMRYFEESKMSECCGLSYSPPLSEFHLYNKLAQQKANDQLEQERREYHERMLEKWERRARKRYKQSFGKKREQAIAEISLLPVPPKKEKKSRVALTDKVRNSVLKRDKHKCTECGHKEGLHVHHKVHRKDGGTDELSNLETLCDLCHAEKHRGEPIYYLMVKSVFKQISV